MSEYVIAEKSEVLNDTNFTTGWTNQGTGNAWVFTSLGMSAVVDQEASRRARRSISADSGLTLTIDLVVAIIDEDAPLLPIKIYLSNGQFIDYGTITNVISETKSESILLTSSITYFEVEIDTSTTGNIAGADITEVTAYTSAANKFLTKLDNYVKWRFWPSPISCIIGGNAVNPDYLIALPNMGNTAGNFEPADPSLVIWDLNKILDFQATTDIYTIAIAQVATNIIISEEKTVLIKDPCDNPIMLMGRNTLGGVLTWVFDVSQDYTFEYADGRKAKRLVLFAEDLTLNEWEALQDFITLGEVYRENIVELTSSTIKTKSRIGAQVYAVDQVGNKIGVTVIPTKNATKTRQVKHRFEIEIEYPEEFNA